MPLLELWESNPQAVSSFTIEQIVSTAGDGNLADGSLCSSEFRRYLSVIPSDKIFRHIERCLSHSISKGGAVLQDLVNELGCRLDYRVENGLYQGKVKAIGYDGVWYAPDGHAVVVEVKTTDAYRINLDVIAGYRGALVRQGRITEQSSILIVVGRQDTGDIEAQIRGSRHAWDIRLISADALINLVRLKESAEEEETIKKIRNLLVPFEYTRLDNIIDVMFATARDVEASVEADALVNNGEVEEEIRAGARRQDRTPGEVIQEVRRCIIASLASTRGVESIATKRALYWSLDRQTRVACSVSKRYERGYYWYAYHPSWDDFLKEGSDSSFVLGCVDRSIAYALPFKVIHQQLEHLNTTAREDGKMYWHIYIQIDSDDSTSLVIPKRSDRIPLAKYGFQIESG